ncbi:MAG: peptide-methionine (S)-S-oxide reductase MsrA [Pseudomonadota bacterium]
MMNGLKVLAVSLLLGFASPAFSASAILAGGCFWCMEADFEKLKGVSNVVSGFTGGSHPDPTYSGAHTGHYEAVEITYDPEVIDYQGILDHFWVNHDPFDDGGQFCDRGHSYLAAIFVDGEAERELAEMSRQKVAERFSDLEVVTPILNRSEFFPIKGAESYHQDFAKNNPIRYKYYRWGCGRDRQLKGIWGDQATVSK